MQTFGIEGARATKDIIDLLNGKADRTVIAKELGLNDADIQRAREAGTLYDYLTQKLNGFAEATGYAAESTAGLEQRLGATKTQVVADATKELTSAYRGFLVSLNELVKSEGFLGVMKLFGAMSADAVNKARQLAEIFTINNPTTQFSKNVAGLKGDLSSVQSQDELNAIRIRAEIQKRAAEGRVADEKAKYDGAYYRNKDGSETEAGTAMLKPYRDAIAEADKLIAEIDKRGAEIIAKNKEDAAVAAKQVNDAQSRQRREEAAQWLEANASKTDKLQMKSEMLDKTDEERLATLKQIIAEKEKEAGIAADAAQSEEEFQVVDIKAAKEIVPLLHQREQLENSIAKAKAEQEKKAEHEKAQTDTDAAKAALQAAEVKRREVENNVYLTREEKREALRQALIAENVEIDKNVALLKDRQKAATDETAKRSYETEINSLGQKKATNTADIGTKYAPQSFGDQLGEGFAKMKDGFTTAASAMVSVMGAAISSVSTGLQGLFNGTMTFGQAARSVFQGIGQSAIKAVSDMAAQWVIKHTLMTLVSRIFHTTDAAAGVTAETTKTAAATTGGGIRLGITLKESLASVYHGAVEAFEAMAKWPYIGPILGAAAMAAAIVGGMALVGKIHLAEGGVFRGSGRVAGPGTSTSDSVNAALSDGEVVINAESAKKIGYDRLLHINETGEMPAFGSGGIFGSIGKFIGKASGWKSWGQFLGSGGLNAKLTGPGFAKFQTQYNLMDGTKLYGGAATAGGEATTLTPDQIATAKNTNYGGYDQSHLDYLSTLKAADIASASAVSTPASGGETTAAADPVPQPVNVYNYTDWQELKRDYRRDPASRKHIINTISDARGMVTV
jgi:hypothetical protein